ncbi:MAG: glycosyltransferase [Acidimicrobiia bacterium]|nr:glycosyltransferase [Acidimicrobiia bacterium]
MADETVMGPLSQRSPMTTPSGRDDRPDPETTVSGHPNRRPLAREGAFAHLIMVIGLVAMVLYAAFRVSTFGDERSFWPINLVLLTGEILAMVAQVALVYDGWRLPPFDPPRGTARPAVDVLIPTYNEPVEVVRPTLAGCLGQDYDGPLEIWLLDDGGRAEMAELAEMLGVTYLTRSDNKGAKAGNINNSLTKLTGELVTVLDCDMVPQPDYVSSLVPYFEDERVALVQTPHGFYNTDSFQHYSEGRHDQSLFYDVIQWGKDRHNAAYWCGTGGMLRTAALKEVGGVAEGTITEDFHTSVRLHAAGWRSRYHPIALSFGLGATDHSTFVTQRDRWGSGNIALLHTDDSPLTIPGLTLRQRLSYVATLVAVLAGLRRILLILGVALILGSGRIPFEAEPIVMVTILGGAMFGGGYGMLALSRGRVALGDLSRAEILSLPAQLSALRTLVSGPPKKQVFKVTVKDSTVEHWGVFLRANTSLVLLTLVLVAGVIIGIARQLTGYGLTTFAATLTFLLAAWEGIQLALAWRYGLGYQQRRRIYRVPIEGRRATLELGDQTVLGRLADLSPSGVAVEIYDDVELELGDLILFSTDGMETPIECSIRRIGDTLGLRFEHVPVDAGIIIDRLCYVDGVAEEMGAGDSGDGPGASDAAEPDPEPEVTRPRSSTGAGDPVSAAVSRRPG